MCEFTKVSRRSSLRTLSYARLTHVPVVKSAEEAGQTFDYIVCCHKAITQDTVPEQIAAGVDEKKTTIVIIQNGVGNEEPFRNRFPTTTILSCVVSRQSNTVYVIHHTDKRFPGEDLVWCPPATAGNHHTHKV